MGIPLRNGRNFSGRDDETALPVAIINETLARRHFPNADPLGQRLRLPFLGGPDSPERGILTIVGIVADARTRGLAADPEPEVYFPHAQVPSVFSVLTIRTRSDAASMTDAVKQQIWSIDKDQPIQDVLTIEQIVQNAVWQLRFSMALLGVFAGVALLLGAAGIYAIMSYSVSRRQHEIGIRMAMGAEKQDVIRMVVGHALKLASLGVVLGLAGAFALTRALSSWFQGMGAAESDVQQWLPSAQRGFLYGVSAQDPITFSAIALVLLAIAVLASVIPARRAAQVDPLVALRYE
jgi:putative ABC transport system permease protein